MEGPGIGTGDSMNSSSQHIGAINISHSNITIMSLTSIRDVIGGGMARNTSKQSICSIVLTASNLSFNEVLVGIGGGPSLNSADQTIGTFMVTAKSRLDINVSVGIVLSGADSGTSSTNYLLIENVTGNGSSSVTCIRGGVFDGTSSLTMPTIEMNHSVLNLMSIWSGISAGIAYDTSSLKLGNISVTDSNLSIISDNGGAIVAGACFANGTISVQQLEISRINLSISTKGTGIGARPASGNASISITTILISQCSGDVTVYDAASCVGTGGYYVDSREQFSSHCFRDYWRTDRGWHSRCVDDEK
jgi:hypothetical protein